MTPPITRDELEALFVQAETTPFAQVRKGLVSRMPRLRGEILVCFQEALADERRKWVAARLLCDINATDPLTRDLLQAAMKEPNPSRNQAFVRPLRRAKVSWETVWDHMSSLASVPDPTLRGGVGRTLYWLPSHIGVPPRETALSIKEWIIDTILLDNDPYELRCLVCHIDWKRDVGGAVTREKQKTAYEKVIAIDAWIRHRLVDIEGGGEILLEPITK